MGLFRRKAPGGVLADEEEVPADRPGHKAAVSAGVPGRCPQCDGFGYIDNIDMRRRIQTQHCLTCKNVWEFSFDADGEVIDLTDGAMERQARPSPSTPG